MNKTDYFYQNVGFNFAVSFINEGWGILDSRFQSISGLDVTMEVESIKEGGENRFEHVLPTRRKYSDLILKRGVLSPKDGSLITRWCLNTFGSFEQKDTELPKRLQVVPAFLSIALLDEAHEPLMKWDVKHAWPKAWKFGELNAEKSEVLIETLELHYNEFEFIAVK